MNKNVDNNENFLTDGYFHSLLENSKNPKITKLRADTTKMNDFKDFIRNNGQYIISLQTGIDADSQYSEFIEHNYSNFTVESDFRNYTPHVQNSSTESIKEKIKNNIEALDNIGKSRKDRIKERKDAELNHTDQGYKLKKESIAVQQPK